MKKFLILFTIIWISTLLIINFTQLEMAKAYLTLYTFILGGIIYLIILQVKLLIDIANRISSKKGILSWQLLLLLLVTSIEIYSIWYVMVN